MTEPWLRGTLTEFDAVRRQVLHSLELAREDGERWCAGLTDEQVNGRPYGMASVAFHLRHVVRSLDRLLTYAAGGALTDGQMASLSTEMSVASFAEIWGEYLAGLERARVRVVGLRPEEYEEVRGVGRAGLPSTVGGLMVHCAEHTQRHVGQMVTTVQVVKGMDRSSNSSR